MTTSDEFYREQVQIDILLDIQNATGIIDYENFYLERIEGESVRLYEDGILSREWFWEEKICYCYFEEIEQHSLSERSISLLMDPSAYGKITTSSGVGYFYCPYVPLFKVSVATPEGSQPLDLTTRYEDSEPAK